MTEISSRIVCDHCGAKSPKVKSGGRLQAYRLARELGWRTIKRGTLGFVDSCPKCMVDNEERMMK